MAVSEKSLANLIPFKPGVSGNPKGNSKKARKQKEERTRLEQYRRAIFGRGGEPERVTGELLVDAINADKATVARLLQDESVPAFVRVIVSEAMRNADFAWKVYSMLCGSKRVELSGRNGEALQAAPVVIQVATEQEAEQFRKIGEQ